ncbi:hypothetical protein [Nonomuraea gerenzanensis]|nr:hypothetical protein [Nonomuraea gerenzanensis]UBU16369.1 hypothetical protein LCN96_15535 [Nonomuraea gerenzanensis]
MTTLRRRLLTSVHRRGLTPLFSLQARPRGEVRFDLSAWLIIGAPGSFGGA